MQNKTKSGSLCPYKGVFSQVLSRKNLADSSRYGRASTVCRIDFVLVLDEIVSTILDFSPIPTYL